LPVRFGIANCAFGRDGIFEKKQNEYPAFAPFTAAGYFVGAFSFLQEKCRSFLPWIFMGEEIIASSLVDGEVRYLWTDRHGAHLRATAQANLQSVHRAFTNGVQSLKAMVLDRVKYQLGYPEAKDMLKAQSILTPVERYSMGTAARPLSEYLKIVGLNMTTKLVTNTHWCGGISAAGI
jgi:hypothetical protein